MINHPIAQSPHPPTNQPTHQPATNPDGTRTGIITSELQRLGDVALLSILLPTGLYQGVVSGQYFLARCGAQTEWEREENWQIYLRRPLFAVTRPQPDPAGAGDLWQLALPVNADPGYHWLANQRPGSTVNLLGPLGHGFIIAPQSRQLLLLADASRAPLLLALCDAMLDRGGRVTFVIQSTAPSATVLIDQMSIPVEVRLAKHDDEWRQQLVETLPWADQVCAALPNHAYPALTAAIQAKRFHLQDGFAQVLLEADLLCGIGACLACVVPVRDGGYTRACVHGPVFDLKKLG